MTEVLSVLDRLPEIMRRPVGQYTELVQASVGPAIRELVFFGAVVAGTFDPSRHTARNVLVVEAIDLQALKRLAIQGPSLGKFGIAAPLVMTPAYIGASLDTFPLEFIEIRQSCVTVWGEPHFCDLAFDDGNVRLQCERECKAMLIGLRQGLLASGGEDRFVAALEEDIAASLLRILRGMLWLKGEREAKDASTVLRRIEHETGRRLDGARAALDPTATHGWAEFEAFYHDVAQLGEVVDAW